MRAGGAIAALPGDTSGRDALLAGLDAAIGGVQSLGKGVAGEKTMLDALHAGRRRRTRGVRCGRRHRRRDPVHGGCRRGGAAATIPMLATKGRASYLGERSIGHQDPGATSAALLLRALADVAGGD